MSKAWVRQRLRERWELRGPRSTECWKTPEPRLPIHLCRLLELNLLEGPDTCRKQLGRQLSN